MRQFARPTPIDRLSLEARILYSGFCLFVLFGIASSMWLYGDDRMGARPADAARYYLGETASPDAATIDGAAVMVFEKPPRQVMETFHFHIFIVPVVLLIVGHIFLMCGWSTAVKAWTLALASFATFVHLAAPLLVRFASAKFAFLVFPSAISMGCLWIVLTTCPIYAMWRRLPESQAS